MMLNALNAHHNLASDRSTFALFLRYALPYTDGSLIRKLPSSDIDHLVAYDWRTHWTAMVYNMAMEASRRLAEQGHFSFREQHYHSFNPEDTVRRVQIIYCLRAEKMVRLLRFNLGIPLLW